MYVNFHHTVIVICVIISLFFIKHTLYVCLNKFVKYTVSLFGLQLRNISCTDEEFSAFKKNLKNALNMVFKASIDCSKVVGLQENLKCEEETLNNILQETSIINEEIVS